MNVVKRKELAILLVGSLVAVTPAFATGGDDDGVNSSSGSSCSSGSSGSASSSGTSGKCKRKYTVGGVITSSSAPGLDVAITCTNMGKSKSIVVGVEVFASNGTLLNQNKTEVAIDVGKSATIVSNPIAAITGDATLDLSGDANPPGAAKITSTSSKIICSALLIDDTTVPPASMTALPVVKGAFRKGD